VAEPQPQLSQSLFLLSLTCAHLVHHKTMQASHQVGLTLHNSPKALTKANVDSWSVVKDSELLSINLQHLCSVVLYFMRKHKQTKSSHMVHHYLANDPVSEPCTDTHPTNANLLPIPLSSSEHCLSNCSSPWDVVFFFPNRLLDFKMPILLY
jgi:hypothetical protein